MSTKTATRLLFSLLLILSPLACRSSSSSSLREVPCTCGTPQADMQGCAHATCLAGKQNPDNPECVCGALSIPKSK